jgi:hypothetical protein
VWQEAVVQQDTDATTNQGTRGEDQEAGAMSGEEKNLILNYNKLF